MTRDLSALTSRRFDLVVVGGGIHGLAVAYDAAQRGLTTALVERGDFGGGTSFNHAKTVHGGLRSLQTGDVAKARFSMGERRAMARIAPNMVTPLGFMMATTRSLMRSSLVLRAGLTLDALVGFDRNSGVAPRLRLPAGFVVGREAYRATFGENADPAATGGARWFDYHMPESDRLTLAFAQGAAAHGAVLANYVEAVSPLRSGAAVTGVRVRDRETGEIFDVEARYLVAAAGAACGIWMEKLGGHSDFHLIKATNVVTSRPAGELAIGAPTSGGRLLLIMPWKGRALIGTSHSESPVEPADTGVSDAQLGAFIDEINSAFPALHLTASDVTVVHRGVVPAERYRNGTLGLMGHHRIHDHAADGVSGALSVVGVKFTTGPGVGRHVVDRVTERLGKPRVPSRSGTTLLPGSFDRAFDDELAEAARAAAGLLAPAQIVSITRTHGTGWRTIVDLCRHTPALAAPVSEVEPVPAAVLVHAVRHEMARSLADVVLRRTNLGAAGWPGSACVMRCADVVGTELGWNSERLVSEIAALRAFYAPVRIPD
jgi:glycerol-3-phosphate dehydrogenase